MSKLDLDLSGVQTQSSRVVVPTGNYPVEVVSSILKETKKKGGFFVETGFCITSGDSKGVTLVGRYNVANANKEAEDIGKSQLKTILAVSEFSNPDFLKDTNEMIGLKLNLYVEEDEHSFQNNDGDTIDTTQNEIKSYFPLDVEKSATPKASVVTASAPVTTPISKSKPVVTETEKTQATEAVTFPWMK